ncbi:MAG TPA: DUF1800 domain-containing protein [Gammaproteobacteria bacterium]|jgi:uncharacterized protein (DUF1800 family)|nr:DUF1800 family protein [Gammaproteobacteria bacterium]HAJ77243.1 DUF1800 domain-containing protein [Gammaproteobacteria bacterium]
MAAANTSDLSERAGYIAGNHFGLGLRPGELRYINSDPRGWLKSQLDNIESLPESLQALPDSSSALIADGNWRRERRDLMQQGGQAAVMEAQRDKNLTDNKIFQQHTSLRLQAAVDSRQAFAERLLRFWSNHFTVAVSGGTKAVLRRIALPYENEAIRSKLGGDFESLLLSVEQHPAMLIYLDNDLSFGPNSPAGRRRERGLNENLAREVLELHTLGVDGGYTQADVTSLAKMITGWTVMRQELGGRGRNPGKLGEFRFLAPAHEPGQHSLLGKDYRANGVRQGEAALVDVAHHPATARHVATRLVSHFVADTPLVSAIDKIATVFMESEGSLPALHAALVDLDEIWQGEYRKLKTPEELIISTARAMNLNTQNVGSTQVFNAMSNTLRVFNHLPFTATSPAGWPDEAEHWGSPDALVKRIEWVNQITQNFGNRINPEQLAAEILPENESLQLALRRAESRSQGLALLLASPDFQWR